MPPKKLDRKALTATRWVHAFEEDTTESEVYRPSGAPIPLSRRPRQRLEFAPDGTALVLNPGPDDRFIESRATWAEEKGVVVLRTKPTRAQLAIELRIVEATSKRLIVRRHP
jgi:hypothetical protein